MRSWFCFFLLICFRYLLRWQKVENERERGRETEREKKQNEIIRAHQHTWMRRFGPNIYLQYFFLLLSNVYLCQFLSMFMRHTINIVVLTRSVLRFVLCISGSVGFVSKCSIQITQKHMKKWFIALRGRYTSLSLCVWINFDSDSINIGMPFQ